MTVLCLSRVRSACPQTVNSPAREVLCGQALVSKYESPVNINLKLSLGARKMYGNLVASSGIVELISPVLLLFESCRFVQSVESTKNNYIFCWFVDP